MNIVNCEIFEIYCCADKNLLLLYCRSIPVMLHIFIVRECYIDSSVT